MFLKSTRMEALARESSGSRPSSLKHWWKVANDEDISGTTLIDIIGGADYADANNAYLSAGIFNPNNASYKPLSAALSAIGTSNFLWVINADVDGFASITIGSNGSDMIRYGDGVVGATSIVGADATVGALDNWGDTSGAYKTHALWYDGTDAHSKIDAGTTNDTTGDPGAITLVNTIALSSIPGLKGMALFIFDGAIPSDIESAVTFMGQCWGNLDKVMYPSSDALWGAWS